MRGMFLAGIALTLVACGGSSSGNGGGSSSSDHELTGTWFGTADMITQAANHSTLTLDIDSDGDITAIALGGDDLDLTAEIIDETSGFYTYRVSDGGESFVRREGNHLVYADHADVFALLERGTDSRPTYSLTDITGEYVGTEYVVDSLYQLQGVFNGEGEITGSDDPLRLATFSPDTGCGTTGFLSLGSSIAGVYRGTFQNVTGSGCNQSGHVKAYLSPDHQAVLVAACESFSSFDVPRNCGFIIGRRVD